MKVYDTTSSSKCTIAYPMGIVEHKLPTHNCGWSFTGQNHTKKYISTLAAAPDVSLTKLTDKNLMV